MNSVVKVKSAKQDKKLEAGNWRVNVVTVCD